MGLFGSNCQNCGTYFSWSTPDQRFNLNSVGAGGGFCSAQCRADYARNRQLSDAYQKQQEREQQIEQQERESEKEQLKRRQLLDKYRTMWFGDLAHQHGMHSIDEWDWCCKECRGAVLNHFVSRNCYHCGSARLRLTCMVTSVEKHDGAVSKVTGGATYGAGFETEFVWLCLDCNKHDDDDAVCARCGEELAPEDLRIYSGAGHHWMDMLYRCRGLAWGPLALNLEISSSFFGGYSPIKSVNEFRKRFGIVTSYPILAAVNFDGSFFDQSTQIEGYHSVKIVIAGNRLFVRQGGEVAKSVSLIDLARQGAEVPQKGWFFSKLKIADFQLKLSHAEAELLSQAVSDIVNGVRNTCAVYNLEDVAMPAPSKCARPPSIRSSPKAPLPLPPSSFPRATPPPLPPSSNQSFDETPQKNPAPSFQSAPGTHLLASEIPERLLLRIRERVKREYRGDLESQHSELETQMDSYRALQEIVALPPEGIDEQTLAKIVRRAQRENPLDLQMQLHEVEQQVEGHAVIEHFCDETNHSEVPKGILNKIVKRAKREHADDFSLQANEVQEQIAAYIRVAEIRDLPPSGVNRKQMAKAIADAEREYPNDYSMQVYEIEQAFVDDTD